MSESGTGGEKKALVVVDVQERLFPAMACAQQPVLVKAVRVLLALAREAGWKVVVTEQYPKGLGRTIAALAEPLREAGAAPPIEKVDFSAVRAPGFADAMGDATEAVVTGMETHVCVLQTVQDLTARGVKVSVPWDGVASRRDEDRTTALERMRAAGATVTSSESLVFEHLGRAGTEAFKRLSKLLR